MPKVNPPSSFDRAKLSPYSNMSNHNKNSNSSTFNIGDETDWEEIQCPICMEHPHDAVLLHCSSRDKGCRPFICDARFPGRSSCLDQFRNSSSSRLGSKISCPLCRGAVTAFNVVNPARIFMNSKTRGCAVETCRFAGNYSELRRHAASQHPPEAAGPTRRSNIWAELQRQLEMDSSDSDSDRDSYSTDSDSSDEESFSLWGSRRYVPG